MSCGSFRHVLALLNHDEPALWAVLERAVELAEAQRARLTLAKTTDPGRIVKWFGPMTILARAPCQPQPDLQQFAQNRLARACEFVPASVSLTTVLLGPDTACALRRLADHDSYDLLVMDSRLAAHNHKLRREIKRLGMCTLTVLPQADSPSSSPAHNPADALTG